MSTASTAPKVCIACGQDCSTKPRTKDTQGRYTCKACLEAAQAKQAASKPFPVARPAAPAAQTAPRPATAKPAPSRPVAETAEPDDDANFMAQLLQDSPATEPCPSCGHPLTAGSVLCTACGYNTQTGSAMTTKKVKAVKEKRQGSGGVALFLGSAMSGLIAAGVLGLLFVAGIMEPAAMILFILAAVLYFLFAFIVFLIDAFKQSVVSGLCCMFLPIYPLYFLISRTESPIAKIHMPIAIVCGIAIRIMAEVVK